MATAKHLVVLIAICISKQLNCTADENLNSDILKELKLLRNDMATLRQENRLLQDENYQLKMNISNISKRIDSMDNNKNTKKVQIPQLVEKNMGLDINTTFTYPATMSYSRSRKYTSDQTFI